MEQITPLRLHSRFLSSGSVKMPVFELFINSPLDTICKPIFFLCRVRGVKSMACRSGRRCATSCVFVEKFWWRHQPAGSTLSSHDLAMSASRANAAPLYDLASNYKWWKLAQVCQHSKKRQFAPTCRPTNNTCATVVMIMTLITVLTT